MAIKNILVAGGGGYLGSILVPMLLERGYHVTVLDRFFFGQETLGSCVNNENCKLIEADTRWFSKDILRNIYAVMDLAALSNDPLSELNPALTLDINFRARIRTATLAKEMGVKKYILASSCSVYGFQDGLLDEESKTLPLTTYAKANIFAEHGVLPLSDDKFTVTVIRQGTLYGFSPRMRFDIVVNTMTLSLFQNGKLNISGGGKQWRPLLHVADSARAFIKVLESDSATINGHIFNAGSTENNYQMDDLALRLASAINTQPIITKDAGQDNRSYRVSCDKIKNHLGYLTEKIVEDGAREVYGALKSGLTDYSVKTRTVEWYKKLLADDPDMLNRGV